jgi:electron transfer flavoprotein alpha subunit
VSRGGLWVLVERGMRGDIHPVSHELLSEGNRLAACLGREPAAVAFDRVSGEEAGSLGRFGARRVLVLEREHRGEESPERDAGDLRSAVRARRPAVILAGATAYGRTVMPLVAVGLRTGLTADCTELAVDRERGLLLQTRPAFGGNILATIECAQARPQMATVRPHVFKTEQRDSGELEVEVLRVPGRAARAARVVENILEEETLDISMSDVIVAGGRGLGRAEGFSLLEKLAGRLGGMVGASRGAVDLGWISSAHQVGQTGHTVNPRLYVACGISGAVQHLAGIKGADTIVAINPDPEAPIFEAADYGIVGDLYEVVPALIAGLEARAGSS